MSYPFNYPTPTNANVQIFYNNAYAVDSVWTKPQGASFVWITLIAPGGGGAYYDGVNYATGGGSGAVTNCLVPAFLIPDELFITPGTGGTGGVAPGIAGGTGSQASVYYQNAKSGSAIGYTLLTAFGGQGGQLGTSANGGAASTSNNFSCMGFFQSVAGQGSSGGVASTTTFLSGGANTTPNAANYGYSTSLNGFFETQPIIVGVGGANNGTKCGKGGIGCGGAAGYTGSYIGGQGGDGLCVIITW